MLKLTSLLAVEIIVPIEIVVVVDINVAVAPIAIAPVAACPSAQRKSGCAPRQSHSGVVSWIGIRIVWIGGRRRSINDLRVV
jgi:hypothetical protein